MSVQERGPLHAPYENVTVGEEVLVRCYLADGDGEILTCEFVFREDTFGGQVDLSNLDHLNRTLTIDALITGVCNIVWNEVLGTPVFHEDEEEWWTRVENAKPWEQQERKPTRDWVAPGQVPEPVEAEPEPEQRDHVAATLGDADVADLKLKQDEMAALMRGEIPEELVDRLLKARSTENLLESVAQALNDEIEISTETDSAHLFRAQRELAEVRSRFG